MGYERSGQRVTRSINPLGKRTTTIYNIASQTLASVDANGNRVSSVYDALGRRTVEVNALAVLGFAKHVSTIPTILQDCHPSALVS